MKILHINFSDQGGGAEEFALSLSKSHKHATLLVAFKHTDNGHVKEFPRGMRYAFFNNLDKILWKLGVKISFRSFFGFQNKFHGTEKVLKRLKEYRQADIIHLHNIHGEYFDLKAVLQISKEKPIIWTSHDEWIFTGGEGFVLKNFSKKGRRKNYPLKGGLIDERKSQLKLKKAILKESNNIQIIAPSGDHMLNIIKTHPNVNIDIVLYGIDTNTFNLNNVDRKNNSIPKLLVFNSVSPYKNSPFIVETYKTLQEPFELNVIGNFLALNENIPVINHGFIKDRFKLAKLFKSIDIGCFSSNAETFGLLPAELAACGAKVFLNKSLPVFEEHEEIYGAILYNNSKELSYLLKNSLNRISNTRDEGLESAIRIEKNLNRKSTFRNYNQLYLKSVT